MDKEIGKHIPGVTERMAFLRDNADAIEKKGYMKQFTADQISDMKDRLAEVSIRLNDIAVAKKEAMDDFKEQAKPFKEEKSELLQQIKERVEIRRQLRWSFMLLLMGNLSPCNWFLPEQRSGWTPS